MQKSDKHPKKKPHSALITKLQRAHSHNHALTHQIQQHKADLERLSLELEQRNGNDINVRLKSNHKNSYTDDVRHTVISLISGAGVSASKVGDVMTIIAQKRFHHKFSDPLPCAQSCINMLDESFVMSNIQLAESILKTKHTTLHSDGTSRDGGKNCG